MIFLSKITNREGLITRYLYDDFSGLLFMAIDKRPESELSIYTINGTKIESRKVEENRIVINMSDYLPGVYLIQFNSNNQLLTQKL
ncbi:MAG: T9SS type A sorting domain-containing protein [Candidatus Parvibacillus calidus]|nr:MAG: T9SS type A sorting domain-containing protein [Candidatus Parvibacillus calidus]